VGTCLQQSREATQLGNATVQRFGISLISPGRPQESVKLDDNQSLVVVAFDTARNQSDGYRVQVDANGNLSVFDLSSVAQTAPYTLKLGGFQILFAFDARPDGQLSYSIGFPNEPPQ
jgi:hypothetical protein